MFENRRSSPRQARLVTLLLLGAILVAGVVVRIALGSAAINPGHADMAYYYGLGEQLATGRGWTPEYIWHYLNAPDLIGHYPNDYWMPLMPALVAVSMSVFGVSMQAVFVVTFGAAVVTGALTFALTHRLLNRDDLALGATALVMFHPILLRWSLAADTVTLFVAFAMLFFYAVVRTRSDHRWWLLAGASVGLANLTRQDGLLLFAVMMVTIVLRHGRSSTRPLLSAGATYAAVMSPLWISNLVAQGTPIPSNMTAVSRLDNYEQLYAFGYSPSLGEYLALGWDHLIGQRIDAAHQVRETTIATMGGTGPRGIVMLLLAIIGGVLLWRRSQGRIVIATAGAALALLVAFHVVVLPVVSGHGGTRRSVTFAIPVVIVLAVAALSQVRPRMVTAVLLLASTLVFASHARDLGRHEVAANNAVGQEQRQIAAVLREHFDDPTVMTRDPWELEVTGGIDSLQIPMRPPARITEMACELGVDAIVASPRARGNRPLGELPLESLGSVGATEIYRFTCPAQADGA